MSSRRKTPIERAIVEERERCIDELLRLAAWSLDHAHDDAESRDHHLDDARGYYRAAWMLATAIDVTMSWPAPAVWIGWAREAMERAA
jgi:hypothetical protein